MRVVLSGCGSIGRRHAKNLMSLGNFDILAYDVSEERLDRIQSELPVKLTKDIVSALSTGIDALLVCSPTKYHVPQALEAVKRGIPTFIEKPLSDSLDRVDDLLLLADQKDVPILVGCNFRFDSGFTVIRESLTCGLIGRPLAARAHFGQFLPNWRPDQDYRLSYSGKQSLGGGVILDQVHEIDYITCLLGQPDSVLCMAKRVSDLEIDTEDTAEILLWLNSGVLASIHVDCIRPVYDRSLEIVGTEGILQWRFQDNFVQHFGSHSREWKILSDSKKHDFNAMYVSEMHHFLEILARRETPLQDGRRGKEVLEIALAAKLSAELGRIVPLSAI